jgi:hypothetical protein
VQIKRHLLFVACLLVFRHQILVSLLSLSPLSLSLSLRPPLTCRLTTQGVVINGFLCLLHYSITLLLLLFGRRIPVQHLPQSDLSNHPPEPKSPHSLSLSFSISHSSHPPQSTLIAFDRLFEIRVIAPIVLPFGRIHIEIRICLFVVEPPFSVVLLRIRSDLPLSSSSIASFV